MGNRGAEFADLFRRTVEGFSAPDLSQCEQLFQHFTVLEKWNTRMSLTTVATLPEAVVRHYAESWFLACHLPTGVRTALDLGSGPGFPGFPVAVAVPTVSMVLLESNAKKGSFLREACGSLGNLRVVVQRSADFVEPVDLVMSRAVRWEDVAYLAKKFRAFVALLTGAGDLEAAERGLGLQQESRIRLPWGDRRLLLLGRST